MSKLSDEWGQFAGVPFEFIEASRDLSDYARWLFVLLRYYTNRNSGDCFPSYDEIQQITGWHRNRIAPALRELMAAGWLERKRRFGQSSIYILKRPDSSTPAGTNEDDVSTPAGTNDSSTRSCTSDTLTRFKESTNSDSLDAATPEDDIKLHLEALGVRGDALDSLALKAIMDGVTCADIDALVSAARADFAARRAEFNAAAFLALYPYKFGWTYQPPAPKRQPQSNKQPLAFTPPPPEHSTHEEVVTRRPYAVLPDITPCPLTAAERKQMMIDAKKRRRDAISHTA